MPELGMTLLVMAVGVVISIWVFLLIWTRR